MPDTPVAPHSGAAYDPVMEVRVSRLEEDVREEKAARSRMEAAIIRIEAMLDATLSHLATKADLKSDIAGVDSRLSGVEVKLAGLEVKLADKPGKTYMWGILAVLLTAYACGLAGLAILK